MRLIDADKLKQHYAWWNDESKELFDTIVDAQPTVEPENAGYIKLLCSIGDTVYWTAGVNVPEKYEVYGFEIDEEMNVYLDVGQAMPIAACSPFLFFDRDSAVKSIKIRQKRRSNKKEGADETY